MAAFSRCLKNHARKNEVALGNAGIGTKKCILEKSFEGKLEFFTQAPDETVYSEMYLDYLRLFGDEKV